MEEANLRLNNVISVNMSIIVQLRMEIKRLQAENWSLKMIKEEPFNSVPSIKQELDFDTGLY